MIEPDLQTHATSRRRLLRNAAYLAASGPLLVVAFAASPAAADSKVPQTTANYQSSPKGAARCDNCSQFEAPSSCKVVQGAVAAAGWCALYATKP
jgi:hypothetical protein